MGRTTCPARRAEPDTGLFGSRIRELERSRWARRSTLVETAGSQAPVVDTAEVQPLIRPMRAEDVFEVDDVWTKAFGALRAAAGTPLPERDAEAVALDRARLTHLLGTDPAGSFVAELDGAVVGLAQSHVREGTFALARLAVLPGFQDDGLGKSLLTAALAYGDGCRAQYIFSSMDPRALHRYVRAGFSLHPTVSITARRSTTRARVPAASIAEGSASDIALVEEIDRAVRGSARAADIEFLLRSGQRLFLDPRGGYALLGSGRLSALGATSEEIARELLRALLAGTDEAEELEISWVVAEQQWAIETAAACGASLRVQGALMTRGGAALPVPYLPNGLFA